MHILNKMEPHLADIDKQMFYSYLDRATVYLEYGSGGRHTKPIKEIILRKYTLLRVTGNGIIY